MKNRNRSRAFSLGALVLVSAAGAAGAQQAAEAGRMGLRPAGASFGVVGPGHTCRAPRAHEVAEIAEAVPSLAEIAAREREMFSVGRQAEASPLAAGSGGLDIQYSLAGDVAADADFVQALEVAAQIWEDLIADDVTLIMDVSFTSNAGFIAATSRFEASGGYATIRDAVVGDASDQEAGYIGELPSSPLEFDYGFTVYIPGISQPEDIVNVSFAQAQALGFNDLSDGNDPDSAITFNTDFPFDNDPADGLTPGFVDTVFVMVHELGHALGFVSGVDGPSFPSVWDLFRVGTEGFANDPDTLSEFATAQRVMGAGERAAVDTVGFFDGIEPSFNLSSGVDGDGRQASHWRDEDLEGSSTVIGVMDPTFNPATIDTLNPISDADLLAFSLMGWDIDLPFAGGEDEPCNAADIAEPFGALDGADVNAFIGAFGSGGSAADIAEPFGTVDGADVNAFIGAFGAGCP